MLLGQNKLLLLFLQMWHAKTSLQRLPTDFPKSAASQSLLIQPLPKLFLSGEEDESPYFYPLLMLL